MNNYQTKSPVLFLVFNRPDTTSEVFEAIRNAKPSKLYIAADGPRAMRAEDHILCQETLAVVQNIDWDCEVKTLFREENLGCKNAISSAIDWFFDNEEEGIILEDDCLPANSFFSFCDTLLEKYRFDTRIRHITGCNLQKGHKWGDGTFYFANQTHVWGWASWKRVWKDYDKDLKAFDEKDVQEKISNIFSDKFVIEDWTRIFREVKAGRIDTWDYQLAFLNFFNNGLSINPNVNLIKNIGFRNDATHTIDPKSPNANIPLAEIDEIIIPTYILPEKKADYFALVQEFNLIARWKKYNSVRYRMKRWFKSKLDKAS